MLVCVFRIDQLAAAMAAYVVKRPQLVVFASHQENALACQVDKPVAAGRGHVIAPSDTEPLIEKNVFAFFGKPARFEVKITMQGLFHCLHAGHS
jgi:hypothetical protein